MTKGLSRIARTTPFPFQLEGLASGNSWPGGCDSDLLNFELLNFELSSVFYCVIFTTTTVWSSVCSASFRNACIAPNSAPTMSLADCWWVCSSTSITRAEPNSSPASLKASEMPSEQNTNTSPSARSMRDLVVG